MAEGYLKETDGTNLGDSALQEHITHWAAVLDRWVRSIDARLGRHDRGDPALPLDEADGGQEAEQ